MLTVITPASGTALTTVETVKAGLDLTGADDDAWLADTIDRVSDRITGWCGRVFGQETVRETFRLHRPLPSLILSRWPVASIASAVEDGAPLSPDAFEISASDGILYRLNAKGRYLSWPPATVAVEYTAGWLLPGQAGRNMPGDIEQAAIDLVTRAYRARGRDPALRSEDVPDVYAASYFDAAKSFDNGLPPDLASALARYRTPGVA